MNERHTYNARTTVVALVNATNEEEALGRLCQALWRAGFEIYDDQPPYCVHDAFQSDEDIAEDDLAKLPTVRR